jgi:hypothetical protein
MFISKEQPRGAWLFRQARRRDVARPHGPEDRPHGPGIRTSRKKRQG